MKPSPSLLFVVLGLSPVARAADITWGSASMITGDAGSGIVVKNYQPNNNVTQTTATGTADILSTGTSMFAMNFTGVSGDTWTNRVTFFESTPQQTIFMSSGEAGAFTQNGVTLSFGPGWIGNTRIAGNSPQGNSYGALVGYTWDTLSYMRYMNATSGALTFSGLTIGQEYAVQYWVQDSRTGAGNINDRTLTLAGSTPVTLDYNNGAGVGQWAIGTFTADSTSQVIQITADSSVQVNMVQLRALPVEYTAANGIWTGGDGNWSTATNWDGNTIAQGIDKSATFNGLTPVTATLDVIRPIGALHFSGSDHTLAQASGSLMLDGDTIYSPPKISVESGRTATVGALLTGSEGMMKTSAGTLNLTGANTYTGATVVNEGTLRLGVSGAIRGGGAVSVETGATLFSSGDWGTGGDGAAAQLGPITLNEGSRLTANSAANGIRNGIILNGATIDAASGAPDNANWDRFSCNPT